MVFVFIFSFEQICKKKVNKIAKPPEKSNKIVFKISEYINNKINQINKTKAWKYITESAPNLNSIINVDSMLEKLKVTKYR